MHAAKLIALDTSHWNKWTDDIFSADPDIRRRGNKFAEDLLERGYTILFTMHHLGEMLALDDEHKTRERLNYLRRIPIISWISYGYELETVDYSVPGSIVDIMAAEAAVAFETGGDVSSAPRDKTRNSPMWSWRGNCTGRRDIPCTRVRLGTRTRR